MRATRIDGQDVWFNPTHVTHLIKSESGQETVLYFVGGEQVTVKESFDKMLAAMVRLLNE